MILYRWCADLHTQLSTHMRRWRRETWWVCAGLRSGVWCWCRGGFDDGGERVGGDEAHEEEGLEDGVGELGGLV